MLIQNSQNIEAVADFESNSEINEYELLLVDVDTDAQEYKEIWGIHDIPYLESEAFKLK